MPQTLVALSSLLWDRYYGCKPPAALARKLPNHRNVILQDDNLLLALAELNSNPCQLECPGGSPTNVAVAFAGLGGKAVAAGAVAPGAPSRRIETYLENRGVTLMPFSRPALHAGECWCFYQQDGERQYLVRFPDLPSQPGETALPAELWQDATWVVISAYELTNARLAEAFVRETIRARQRGVRLAFDASDSTFLERNRRFVQAILSGHIDVLMGSPASLQTLAGMAEHRELKGLVARTPLVLVTRGAEGTTLHTHGNIHQLRVNAVPVVDTTGAGDTLLGAFLWALGEGAPPFVALRLGQLAAEQVVQVVGPHLPQRDWQRLRARWSASR